MLFNQCWNKEIHSLSQCNFLSGCEALDVMILDIFGLTQSEPDEIYRWPVCELVKNRLEKARSV